MTPLVNVMRSDTPAAVNAAKTHCKHGHEFTPENTRLDRGGYRCCRTCDRAKYQAWYAKTMADPSAHARYRSIKVQHEQAYRDRKGA